MRGSEGKALAARSANAEGPDRTALPDLPAVAAAAAAERRVVVASAPVHPAPPLLLPPPAAAAAAATEAGDPESPILGAFFGRCWLLLLPAHPLPLLLGAPTPPPPAAPPPRPAAAVGEEGREEGAVLLQATVGRGGALAAALAAASSAGSWCPSQAVNPGSSAVILHFKLQYSEVLSIIARPSTRQVAGAAATLEDFLSTSASRLR
jgi:hypothetical protein